MGKEPRILLYDGSAIPVDSSDGMYRAAVGGLSYCSPTFDGLLYAVAYFHSVYTSHGDEPTEVDPVAEHVVTLRTGSTLEARQKALHALENFVDSTQAVNTVARIHSKPVSFGASYITRCLGKKDFSQVAAWEISDVVQNIIHRGELIRELSERVKLDA